MRMMLSRHELIILFDIFARLIRLIDNDSFVLTDYRIGRLWHSYREKLDSLFQRDDFLASLNCLALQIEQSAKEESALKAYVVCLWIDGKLTYVPHYDGMISLYPLISISDSEPVVVYSLNSNYKDTGIWINPKFPVRLRHDAERGDERPFSLGVSFVGINSELKNVSYYIWDGSCRIRNVILSETNLIDRDYLTVAFAPMTCDKELFDKHIFPKDYDGKTVNAIKYVMKEGKDCFTRLKKDCKFAAENNVDILFMPEMIGKAEYCGSDTGCLDWLQDIIANRYKDALDFPMITILPSYCCDGKNSATIVYKDGSVLAVQNKQEPYVNKNKKVQEALDYCDQKEYVIIHIPHVHRLAVLICYEYLIDSQVKWSDVICRSVGATLIIVPSFSSGELAFDDTLSRYREYDTSVIWGNCCGAIRSDAKLIGGCSISGLNIEKRFGDYCSCGHNCSEDNKCIFVVKLPLEIVLTKNRDYENMCNPLHIHEE